MAAEWCELLEVDGPPVRGEPGEFHRARAVFADLRATAGPVVDSFARLRERGLGGSAAAIEAAGQWVAPFADLVDQVDSGLGDLPRVCDDLVAVFDTHLDELDLLWLESEAALRWAREAFARLREARVVLVRQELAEESARAVAGSLSFDDPTALVAVEEAEAAARASASARSERDAARSELARIRERWDALRDREERLNRATAGRIGDQWLGGLKDPGRLQSMVSAGWGWVSDLDNLHIVLDVAGMVPVIGNVADGINTALYLVEGDWENAALAGLAMVPVAGVAVGARRAVRGVDRVAEARRAAAAASSPQEVVDIGRRSAEAADAQRWADTGGQALVPPAGLASHEVGPGHVLRQHVCMDADELAGRLAGKPHLSEASTFSTRAGAEDAIGATIDSRSADIAAWLGKEGMKGKKVVELTTPEVTGVVLTRGLAMPELVTGCRVVLVPSDAFDTGYQILTAYPIP